MFYDANFHRKIWTANEMSSPPIFPRTTRSLSSPRKIHKVSTNMIVFNPANLLLLSLSEVILDVEGFTDLLRSLPLDHVCHSLAGNIQESLIDGEMK